MEFDIKEKIKAELDEPTYEAEWCDYCFQRSEDNEIEYEFNVTWNGNHWICNDCGRIC